MVSALAAQITVLRAEARALTAEAFQALAAAQAAMEKGKVDVTKIEAAAATVLVRLSNAKTTAAALLEAEDSAVQPPDEGERSR